MNKLLISIVVLAAILVAAFFLTDGSTEVKEESYVKYENSELGFEILRPKEAQVTSEGEGRVKFTFLGPATIPNSEITDGFTLTIFKDAMATTSSLSNYARSKAQEAVMNGGSSLTDPELVIINGMEAYKYSFRNLLDTTSWEYVFMAENQPYTATYTLVDPANNGYEEIVSDMLNSIRFY